MYVAIDIGGTKTLIGIFSHTGDIISSEKFPTAPDYPIFLKTILQHLQKIERPIEAICIAAPGKVSRQDGVVEAFGNLDWKNIALKKDIQKHFDVPILVENDANLAGLSEAQFIKNDYKKILYVTISTGIGTGIITNGIIDPDFADSEGGQMPLEHDGKIIPWEDFASGKAIQNKYGKLASEITDPEAWNEIARNIAIGLYDLLALLQPNVIILGGGALSKNFHLLIGPLKDKLNNNSNPLITIPPILQAHRPEEAVIYGCYELIKMSI